MSNTETERKERASSVQDRINCLLQAINLPKKIRPPLAECLARPFEWYGLSRAKIRSQLKVIQSNSDSVLYESGGYRMWWPKVASPERLVYIIMESDVSSNPHNFTPANLKPWNPDGSVIDVGSCEGLFALRAIREFNSKRVLAIEPGAIMAGLLKATFDANQCGERVKVVQCLLGKQRGMAAFRECLSDPALSSVEDLNETNKEFAVKIVPLDDLVEEQKMAPVRAIKIDAEGADLDILMGAENIIRKSRPHLLVTTYHVAEHALQMRNWLESLNLGYKFVFRGVVMQKTSKVRPVLMLATAD